MVFTRCGSTALMVLLAVVPDYTDTIRRKAGSECYPARRGEQACRVFCESI